MQNLAKYLHIESLYFAREKTSVFNTYMVDWKSIAEEKTAVQTKSTVSYHIFGGETISKVWALKIVNVWAVIYCKLKEQCQVILNISYTSKFCLKLKNNDYKRKINR